MAVGCGAKCAKYMLIFFNFLFWLSGAGLLGVGLWLLLDKSVVEIFKLVALDQSDPWLNYAAYVFIGVGVFVFIVGFCGCCGAIKESKCLLGIYIGFLFVVMAGELAAGILAFVYKDKVIGKLQKELTEELQKQPPNSTFFLSMAFAQKTFKCCGVANSDDYKDSNYTAQSKEEFPPTCCILKDTAKETEFKDVAFSDAKDAAQCKARAEGFYQKDGCLDGIKKFFEEKAIILIAVGIGLACLEIFGFIFACCLCRNIGEEM
jgi:hypothetical protein